MAMIQFPQLNHHNEPGDPDFGCLIIGIAITITVIALIGIVFVFIYTT